MVLYYNNTTMEGLRMTNDMELPTRECKRCRHKWILRKPEEPITCPRCKTPYWNRKRIRGKKKEK
jgi:Zn finger protein HypA/HybF involved in hydrogenase expression